MIGFDPTVSKKDGRDIINIISDGKNVATIRATDDGLLIVGRIRNAYVTENEDAYVQFHLFPVAVRQDKKEEENE